VAGFWVRGLWPLGAAAACGAVAALGQAPWGLWPLTLAGLAGLLWLIAGAQGPRAAFARGWWGGAAMFAVAMSWIVEPFFIEPERHGWMAPFALLILPGGLALFWGGAAWLAQRLTAPGAGRGWAAAVTLTGAEAVRGLVFGGFPWAMPGHVWTETPVAQVSALTGPLGLTGLTLAVAAGLAGVARALAGGLPASQLPAEPVPPSGAGRAAAAEGGAQARVAVDALPARTSADPMGLAVTPTGDSTARLRGRDWAGPAVSLAGPVALLALGWVWGAGELARPMPADRDARVRLVQPNADQALKWDWSYAELFFFRHLDLTAAPAADGRAPDLVIWAETAVPFYLDAPGDGLVMAAEAAGGSPLVLGIQRREGGAGGSTRYFNSLAVLDGAGAVSATYDKHHLVPFGEYVPVLGRFADRPGLVWVTGLMGQSLLGYSPGPGPELLDLGPLGVALPLICYEAVFPRHLRTHDRPDWLMQLTNDAWFGVHTGPYQHLALARLRAIEQGLPMLRVANTGVSAVIDARGRVRDSLALNVAGFLDADLPTALPPTPYARTGDLPWYLALLAALGALMLRARRRLH
jgi:apolipoprotein N-acyltransferase